MQEAGDRQAAVHHHVHGIERPEQPDHETEHERGQQRDREHLSRDIPGNAFHARATDCRRRS